MIYQPLLPIYYENFKLGIEQANKILLYKQMDNAQNENCPWT